MRVISVSTLKNFWASYPVAEQPLRAWYAEAKSADWASPADVKAQFRSASILQGGRVVFNIAGNKFRLVVAILYNTRIVLIRFVGTHDQYNKIDAASI